jgi:hypothetical protein
MKVGFRADNDLDRHIVRGNLLEPKIDFEAESLNRLNDGQISLSEDLLEPVLAGQPDGLG